MKASDHRVFDLLLKPIRKVLCELGFSEPTLPQIMAIPPILDGENVLLIAPTGSGKTEAVLLPIFSKLIQQEKKKGIIIVYITPLRALNRDLLKRLTFWANRLDISIQVRHGDTDLKLRRKQAISPPQMLVTTPETLQAILPGSKCLKCVRACPAKALDNPVYNSVEGWRINKEKCHKYIHEVSCGDVCGLCIKACIASAMNR